MPNFFFPIRTVFPIRAVFPIRTIFSAVFALSLLLSQQVCTIETILGSATKEDISHAYGYSDHHHHGNNHQHSHNTSHKNKSHEHDKNESCCKNKPPLTLTNTSNLVTEKSITTILVHDFFLSIIAKHALLSFVVELDGDPPWRPPIEQLIYSLSASPNAPPVLL